VGRALRDVYGCDEGVSVLEEGRRTGNYYHSVSVRVVKGDTSRSHNAPSNPALHH